MEFDKPELYAILGAMVTVISILWGVVMMWIRHNTERLRKYEHRQDDYNLEIKRLTGDVNFLQGQMRGVTDLSQSVLKEISKLRMRNKDDD